MKKTLLVSGALLVSILFSGCEMNSAASVDQSNLCTFQDDQGIKECKSGEIIYFAPNSWGNEQMPLSVAAAYCDFNHPVMYNNSGVVCVYTDKRLHLIK